MEEREWLASTDQQGLLAFLQDSGMLTERKLRLYAGACCRLVWPLLTDPRSRTAVEAAESDADGLISAEEQGAAYRAAHAAVRAAQRRRGQVRGSRFPPEAQIEHAAKAAERATTQQELLLASAEVWVASGRTWVERRPVRRSQASLLRCLFGNPFRPPPPLAASVLQWHDGTVKRLAEEAYQERLLPSGHLDPHRLAVLADALLDAGCTDPDILGHLRGPGPHYRGCHVVDLLTGRE